MIAYRILKPDDEAQTINPYKRKSNIAILPIDTFKLSLSYSDPFLNRKNQVNKVLDYKNGFKGDTQVDSRKAKLNKNIKPSTVLTLPIKFLGVVTNSKSKSLVALLSTNGTSILVQENDLILDSLKVTRISSEFVFIKSNKGTEYQFFLDARKPN